MFSLISLIFINNAGLLKPKSRNKKVTERKKGTFQTARQTDCQTGRQRRQFDKEWPKKLWSLTNWPLIVPHTWLLSPKRKLPLTAGSLCTSCISSFCEACEHSAAHSAAWIWGVQQWSVLSVQHSWACSFVYCVARFFWCKVAAGQLNILWQAQYKAVTKLPVLLHIVNL